MKRFNPTEKAAHKLRHPKKPVQFYEVIHCGKPVYQKESYRLCDHFIKTNALKGASIKPVSK